MFSEGMPIRPINSTFRLTSPRCDGFGSSRDASPASNRISSTGSRGSSVDQQRAQRHPPPSNRSRIKMIMKKWSPAASNLRRYSLSSTSTETSESEHDCKDDEWIKVFGNKQIYAHNEKRDPYALDDGHVSASSNPIACTPLDENPAPPALVMAPRVTFVTDLSSDSNSSLQPDPLRRSLLMSECDALGDNESMKRPQIPLEHTSMTNTTSNVTLDSRHNPKSEVSLNSQDGPEAPDISLAVCEEGAYMGIKPPGMRIGIMTNRSDLRTWSVLNRYEKRTKENDFRDIQISIIGLPWHGNFSSDPDPRTTIHGKYTGPVSKDHLLPHGKGSLVIQNRNENLTFNACWDNGKLISTLSAKTPQGRRFSESLLSNRDGRGSNALDEHLQKSPVARSNSSPQDVFVDNENAAANSDKSNKPSHASDVSKRPSYSSPPLQKYTLGEVCSSAVGMIVHRSNEMAIQSVAQLQKWDWAFVKRSDGLWTAAILIDRGLQPKNDKSRRGSRGGRIARWHMVYEVDPRTMELEESMLFAINGDGATKIIRRECWGKHVRRMKV